MFKRRDVEMLVEMLTHGVVKMCKDVHICEYVDKSILSAGAKKRGGVEISIIRKATKSDVSVCRDTDMSIIYQDVGMSTSRYLNIIGGH